MHQSHLPDLPTLTPQARLIQRLTQHVVAEAETARARVHAVWEQPLAARVQAGRAIDRISIVAISPEGLLTLRCPRNESRFREGDVLCLSRSSPFYEPVLLVTLEADEDTDMLVSTEDPAVHLSAAFQQREGWVLDEGLLDFSPHILDALHQAADTAAGRLGVLPLLTGERHPQIDIERYERALAYAQSQGLNAMQAEALACAYGADLAYLIQGPPGTGKTRLIAHLARLLIEEGERVLLSAFTHRAIHTMLNALVELNLRSGGALSLAKIGHHVRTDDLLVETYARFETSPMADMTGSYAIGATPFATRSRRLRGVEFDTVIIDEASQMTLPLAIMAMLTAKRFIFVGDQCQLPPVLLTRTPDGLLDASVFGALVDRGFDTMLEETYRLNAALAAWPSAQFYGERLYPAEHARARQIAYQSPPTRFAEILDPARPLVFVELRHRNATTRSQHEASLIVDLIQTLLACGIPPQEIGVVVPFRAQSRMIRGMLRVAIAHEATRRALVVDTVERMQGQEREVVLVSLTTSHQVFAAQMADFLYQPQRLNVAITRPRSKLIILGSNAVHHVVAENAENADNIALLHDLLAQCERVHLPW